MSLAGETREAVRARPFLLTALRAGVVNYSAAANLLALDGDPEAVATALRRFAADLPAYDPESRQATVRMRSGVGRVETGSDPEPLLSVGDVGFSPDVDGGRLTAVVASGAVDTDALATVLSRLSVEDVTVEAAGVGDESLIVVVGRRDGAGAVRVVEDALRSVS
ncbi:DUF7523 family protein [Salinirubrum litoreum]|uniref:ACT domain-containing protein n=1 Tax=Salinirubrum litoreum TaxID=1126234 RepID=A0ABD5RA35_9EURY|nr:hypothetical protein [Salinirubrum litoreum]